MRLIFATVALTFGISLLVLTFAWRHIPIPFLQTNDATGLSFLITVVMAMPFVATYTTLGLNSAEGEEPSPETKARHAALRRECRIWPVAWYGGICFVAFVWVGYAAFQLPVHPFFAFSGWIACLTGVWFLYAYPVAIRLFNGEVPS